ncbi:MAG: HepT-like ribonuclease domain-containing protein [Candidatus Omnitrophota bacterium]
MQNKVKKYLFDVKKAIGEIESFIKNKNYQDFADGTLLQSAVERKLEIVGEALNRIGKLDGDILNNITDARRIIGFRNIIIHGYDVLDSKIVWDALQNNLPQLKKEIDNLMED